MNKNKSRFYSRLIILAAGGIILTTGIWLRAQSLSALNPFEADERSWILLGVSLLEKGVPASWTIYWDKYPRTEHVQLGEKDHLVAVPYLDHPPLFGIGVGVWAGLTGNNTAAAFNWSVLRMPMLGLALGTIVLTTLFAKELLGPKAAAITLAAFCFFPTHVVASRFVAAENMIALGMAASLYLLSLTDREKPLTHRTQTLVMLGLALTCGTAILFKLSGIVIPATVGLIALIRKNWEAAIVAVASVLASVGFLAIYAWHYGGGLFWEIVGEHTGRPQSFWNFWSVVTQMDLGYLPMRDPSLIVGLVGIFILLANRKIPSKKRVYVLAPMLCFSLLFLWVAPVEAYGWYRYAILPVLAIGLGYVFGEFMQGKLAYYVLMLPLVGTLLEQGDVLADHNQRRWVLLALYGMVAGLLIMSSYAPRFKRVAPFVARAVVLTVFLLEAIWVTRFITLS